MQSNSITNEMLYELLREFKADVARRFDDVDRQLTEIRSDMREEKRRLDQVYEARESVKIKFSWQWSAASLFIALIASLLTGSVFR